MTRPSIVDLRQFYSSHLGRKVKQRLRQIVRGTWLQTPNCRVVGVGYAVPVLRALEQAEPSHIVALMPADQGAIYWPVHHDNRSVLGDEMLPPFAVSTLDRVILLHAFEHVTRPLELLKIYWQLLVPGGRMLLVVPNRRGLWSGFSATPFARGIPYSMTQLRELLNESAFTVRDATTTLFAPPSSHPFWLRLWGVLEFLGRILLPNLGGVLVIEAEKQIYAGVAQPSTATRRDWVSVPAISAPVARVEHR